MKLSSEWFRHLPTGEQKSFEELVRSSSIVLSRLQALLKEKTASIERWETDPASYDSGYAYKQAYINGKRAGLEEALRLLEFLDQEKRKS